MPKQERGMRNAAGGRRRRSSGAMGAISGAPLTVSTNTTNMHDTVNWRPETAAFDAVLGRSLTVGGLGVTCAKGHGRPGLLPPVLRVGRAWCLGPLIDQYPLVMQPPQHHPRSPSVTLLVEGSHFWRLC